MAAGSGLAGRGCCAVGPRGRDGLGCGDEDGSGGGGAVGSRDGRDVLAVAADTGGTVADGLEPEALGMGTAVAARIEAGIAGKVVAAGSAIAVVALGSSAQGSPELLADGGHCR